jgi:hypothetical protein
MVRRVQSMASNLTSLPKFRSLCEMAAKICPGLTPLRSQERRPPGRTRAREVVTLVNMWTGVSYCNLAPTRPIRRLRLSPVQLGCAPFWLHQGPRSQRRRRATGLANPSLALASCTASHQEIAPHIGTNENLQLSTTDAQPGRMWLNHKEKSLPGTLPTRLVGFHFQYSFYLEVIVFCPFRTQVLFPMSSGNAPGLFNQTDQTWMATCISILQSNGLRNGTAFSGLVDGIGQAMTTFSDNTWGINLSTCYKYCNASAIPLV